MENNTGTFETGATSAAVNELILYTDNTAKLAELRDNIYATALVMSISFLPLLDKAQLEYYKEFKTTNPGITNMTPFENEEYCRIYANRFADWKMERELQASQKTKLKNT